ncbi:MAG: FMN-binding negative transcriptional regulator [Bifidobacteriaceae bacterium]|jgi:transcriptional regulator|nr:FMN-binding negative transcriptional regulator [Bifidobacteriaceae bacterium]
MHTFAQFTTGSSHARQIIARHPLALVVAVICDAWPEGVHVPVVFANDEAPDAPVVGSELVGHMARSNPLLTELRRDGRALAVFTGPGCYVSPTATGVEPDVPTWDYAAVHVRGRVAIVDDEAGCLKIVTRTVEAFEALEPVHWDMAGSLTLFRRIVRDAVGFRLRVEAMDEMVKMSQDLAPETRRRIAQAASERGGDGAEVAEWIRRTGGEQA